ncbi:hypothetical protein SB6095_02463 [Klebsiella quasivariicola]|nr:hypothetical protein SB6095_02463 [Klebsiella quasivariicola]
MILSCTSPMHDHIRKYCLCLNVFAVWIKFQMSEPFRVNAVPVVFAIYSPTGETLLEVHRKAKGNRPFVSIDTEKIMINE